MKDIMCDKKKGFGTVWIFFSICLWGLVSTDLIPISCWGADSIPKPIVFSLDVKGESLREVFIRISKATGYKITINEEWANRPLTAKLNKVSIEEALEKVLTLIGSPSHAIVTEGKREVKIFIYGSNATSIQDKSVITLTGDGIVGLTMKELKALHAKQEREAKTMAKDPNEVVIPPEGGHPGVTRKELQALHERQMRGIEMGAKERL